MTGKELAVTLPSISPREMEWIRWILPAGRPGYRAYRDQLDAMTVIGEGRRGEGELIFGREGTDTDFSAPLAPVFAYGAIETNFGTISISLREIRDGQISVEIVNQRSDAVPAEFEEARRWTYSEWSPAMACPKCDGALREVPIRRDASQRIMHDLVFCPADRRMWVYEAATQVNHLIPVTNFYNELMLVKHIRDPKTALDAKRLFGDLPAYTDDDLVRAFVAYNGMKTKVHFDGPIAPAQPGKRGILGRFRDYLAGTTR